MLDMDIQYKIFDLVPSTFINDTITATKLNQVYETNKYPGLVIAVQFLDFNTTYFRSIDEYGVINTTDDTVEYKKYLQCTLRLIVGADDEAGVMTNDFTYDDTITSYRLTEPVNGSITVTSNGGATTYIEDTDYELNANGIDVEWLGASAPADNDTFNVSYDATRQANWVIGKVLKELNTWTLSTLEGALRSDDISVLATTDITDLTQRIGTDALLMKAFSIQFVYPDTWSVDLNQASTPLESIDVDLEDISITIN